MSIPRKKRRIRLLIILGRAENYYGVKMLSDIQPIYDKLDNSQSLNSAEETVAQKVDEFYAAHDANDSENFDPCTCSQLNSETLGVKMDALESAINNL